MIKIHSLLNEPKPRNCLIRLYQKVSNGTKFETDVIHIAFLSVAKRLRKLRMLVAERSQLKLNIAKYKHLPSSFSMPFC